MNVETLKSLFNSCKETALSGRYIHHEHIADLLKKHDEKFTVTQVGKSVNGIPIFTITLGTGFKKIFMWSQMHGNESTTTKAVFDILNLFSGDHNLISSILDACTIQIIPILNPDGALAYTRLNANQVDLNRDAQELSQPESKVLRAVFDEFKPDFCFNLHGQRTIFSAGTTSNSATVSFLAPAQDEARTVTSTRQKAMELIVAMNSVLQKQIKNQVGLYDDGFNLNCVGDTFQAANVPTVLFEAGHYQDDYRREQTREFIFQSMLVALSYIAKCDVDGQKSAVYFEIPRNKKLFYDVIIRNTNALDVGIQYQERLVDGVLKFIPKIEKISDLSNFYGHKELDANGYEVFAENGKVISEGNEIDFVVIDNVKFLLNL
ncbi:M14 family zinc carboxypeptidase [Psychroserpens sp. SPM9]|uniref:M14 family zinc carboxypeptidase n=1 Tax=Psychroserpens sp. SPM9 TaxID=2975598 RepID=UPI0021A81760|nr:M14 family zinc carboxypeptidase [Psychroserpens sp. SPM9]MDG5491947.1 M14 family zinc carboxypeptidase [Psychroserpens sp. SPM9]